jgi:hypothetical protein
MKLTVWIIGVTIASLCTACFSDDGPLSLPPTNGFALSNIEIADIEGTWEATEVRITTTVGQTVQEMEVISMGGSGTLVVNQDGRFTIIIIRQQGGGVFTGAFAIDGGVFTTVFDNEPDEIGAWIAQKSGNTLILQGPIKYDFEKDGSPNPATLKLNLIKS